MASDTPRFGLSKFERGDTDWTHSDLVDFVDENAIERGPISERPASGDYDDEFYFAEDQNILWRWDDTAGDWNGVSGRGSESQPLPGTVYRESVSADELYNADNTVTARVGKDGDEIWAKSRGEELIRSTNAREVIQAALDYIGAFTDPLGGHLKIQRGEYVLDGAISVPRHTWVQGETFGALEGSTILKLDDGVDDDIIHVPPNGGGGNPLFTEFSHLSLHGNKANNSSGHGIHIDQDAHGDATIRAVFAHRCAGDGFYVGQAWGVKIQYAFAEFCVGNGVTIESASGGGVMNCKLSSNDGNGLETKGNSTFIVANECNDNGGKGIWLAGQRSEGARVVGNEARDNDASTHNCQIGLNHDNASIIGNHVDGNGATDGIASFGVTDAKIGYNNIRNTANKVVRDSSDVRLRWNGVGVNGNNDPASAGDWNGNGEQGMVVEWDDGAGTNYASQYLGGGWRQIATW